jgi:hypothetical protein
MFVTVSRFVDPVLVIDVTPVDPLRSKVAAAFAEILYVSTLIVPGVAFE